MTGDIADLHGLDRDIARAWGAYQRWTRDLARDLVTQAARKDDDPIASYRHVAGQRTYDALAALVPSALDVPHRDALRRWIYTLTQARIGLEVDAELAVALAAPETLAALPVPRHVSWREAWSGIAGAASPAEGGAWLDAAAARGPEIAAIARRRAERRLEVARRLGLERPGALATSLPRAALDAAAESFLVRTDDLTRACLREARARAGATSDAPTPLAAIALGVARDASEGWPARRTAAWIDETFAPFTRGLRLELAPPPAILGASSFARALGAFGHAFRLAGTSPSLPFALARDPFFASAHRFAFVFAALPTSPAFHQRVLRTSARIGAAQARELARTALLEARLGAARFLLTDEVSPAPRDRFEELTARLFGAPLPDGLAGAWPAARDDEPARLLALFGALASTRTLIDQFDIDWFANPRAVRHLRAIASAPARDEADPTDLAGDALALARAFEEALG